MHRKELNSSIFFLKQKLLAGVHNGRVTNMSACLPQAMKRKNDGTDQNERAQNNIPRGQVVEWASEVERRMSIIQKECFITNLRKNTTRKILYEKVGEGYSPYLNILLLL